MNYGTVRPALLALVKQISGLECVWKDQPQGYVPPQGYGQATPRVICKLSLGPASGKGRDELRTEYDEEQPLGEELQDTAIGVRVFTLKILVESLDQADPDTAEQHLSRIRLRFRRRSSTEALNAVNVSFVSAGDVVDLSNVRDSRAVSIANLDVRLSGVGEDVDPARYGYIEKVETEGP